MCVCVCVLKYLYYLRFALPPPQEGTATVSSELLDTEKATSGHGHPSSLVQSNTSLGKRKRAVSPELCSPQSSPELVSSSDDVIDLTQD